MKAAVQRHGMEQQAAPSNWRRLIFERVERAPRAQQNAARSACLCGRLRPFGADLPSFFLLPFSIYKMRNYTRGILRT